MTEDEVDKLTALQEKLSHWHYSSTEIECIGTTQEDWRKLIDELDSILRQLNLHRLATDLAPARKLVAYFYDKFSFDPAIRYRRTQATESTLLLVREADLVLGYAHYELELRYQNWKKEAKQAAAGVPEKQAKRSKKQEVTTICPYDESFERAYDMALSRPDWSYAKIYGQYKTWPGAKPYSGWKPFRTGLKNWAATNGKPIIVRSSGKKPSNA